MGRLYPRMRERPPEFRINYDAPLAEGLVFAGLGGHGCVGSMVYPDSSLYANHAVLFNMNPTTSWVWDSALRRFVLRFRAVDNPYVATLDNRMRILPPASSSVWIYRSSPSYRTSLIELTGNYWCHFPQQDRDGTDGSLATFWAMRDIPSNYYANVTSPGVLSLAQWTQVGVRAIPGGQIIKDGVAITDIPGVSGIPSTRTGLIIGRANNSFDGYICDPLVWSRMLTLDEYAALADPSNVDLRVFGVPLILPPRRRFWPVVSEQAIRKMVPWHLFQNVGV